VTLWSIGHSVHPVDVFLSRLARERIEQLADVRRYAASRRHPQFAREALEASLREAGIAYLWIPELGGRRAPRPDSPNTGWRDRGFRGYADYMASAAFESAAIRLTALGRQRRTAFMCAEAAWQQCHRGLIADWLKARGEEVLHILRDGSVEPHPWTASAHLVDGRLSYAPPAQRSLGV
jgi:uncharacterized protein (DUF488 family)